jgi:hypothetical protein
MPLNDWVIKNATVISVACDMRFLHILLIIESDNIARSDYALIQLFRLKPRKPVSEAITQRA